jgi:hypothetical protein
MTDRRQPPRNGRSARAYALCSALWAAAFAWLGGDIFGILWLAPIFFIAFGVPAFLRAQDRRHVFPRRRPIVESIVADVISHSIRGWHRPDVYTLAIASAIGIGTAWLAARLLVNPNTDITSETGP